MNQSNGIRWWTLLWRSGIAWRIGFVRILCIIILAITSKGISYNYDHHTLLEFQYFSGPTCVVLFIVGVALWVLAVRSEREHEQISKLSRP